MKAKLRVRLFPEVGDALEAAHATWVEGPDEVVQRILDLGLQPVEMHEVLHEDDDGGDGEIAWVMPDGGAIPAALKAELGTLFADVSVSTVLMMDMSDEAFEQLKAMRMANKRWKWGYERARDYRRKGRRSGSKS